MTTSTATWTAFELERWQSDWEHTVEINLADGGVAPVTLAELLDGDLSPLDDHPLHYPEVNGTRRLRERVAALYPGCAPDQVLVTVGAAEANSLVVRSRPRRRPPSAFPGCSATATRSPWPPP